MAKHSTALLTVTVPLLMTRRECAEYLRISIDGLNALVHRNDDPLPRMEAGRRFLFDPTEVLAWARRQADRKIEAQKNPRSRR